jgi:hypothetical protein
MKHLFLSLALMAFLTTTANAQSQADLPLSVERSLLSLENRLDKFENATEAGLNRLDGRIDGVSNGMLGQIIFPLVIGLITYLLGLWTTKLQMRTISDAKIKEWLEKIAPVQCDIALKEYLKAKFPGNLSYLMAAAQAIAYDQELRQTKKVRILGVNPVISHKIVEHLRENKFLQVEFVTYVEGKSLPEADLILIDRYSCLKSEKPMEENQVRDIIKAAKASPQNPCVHYFGKFIAGLPEIMTEKHALSNAEFSLVPNLMDHLRFAFPQP